MPQPRKPEDEKPTAEEVAKDRTTPEAEEESPFSVEDFCVRGDQILGKGITLPDIRAAFTGLPKTRRISVSDARKRMAEWLTAPISTDPPLEG